MTVKNFALCLLLALPISAYSFENSKVADVSGKYLILPSPYGFYIESDKDIVDFFQTMLPLTTVQAVMYPVKEQEKSNRYITINSIKAFEKKNYSKESFKSISDAVVKNQHTFLRKTKKIIDTINKESIKRINDKYDININNRIDEATSLGLFHKRDNAVSLAAIVQGEVSMDGYIDDALQIMSMSILRIKGKILYVYVYSDYTGDIDIIWVKSKTRELVNLLLEVNN